MTKLLVNWEHMYTEYFGPVNREELGCSSAQLESAARKLQQGGLVAFPSETVYGLGAAILNEGAIKRLYQVKERPEDRALPIQVANLSQLQFVAIDIPSEAHALAKEFLPGPLTLILKKSLNLSPSNYWRKRDSCGPNFFRSYCSPID